MNNTDSPSLTPEPVRGGAGTPAAGAQMPQGQPNEQTGNVSGEHYGMPGPGGSLGRCAICGESFLAAIVMGTNVDTFRITGCDQSLHAHPKCADPFRDGAVFDILTLPTKSPLRQAYEALEALPVSKP